jgi:hypothetical protein
MLQVVSESFVNKNSINFLNLKMAWEMFLFCQGDIMITKVGNEHQSLPL